MLGGHKGGLSNPVGMKECGERAREGSWEDLLSLSPLRRQIEVKEVEENQADRVNFARPRGMKRPEGTCRTG